MSTHAALLAEPRLSIKTRLEEKGRAAGLAGKRLETSLAHTLLVFSSAPGAKEIAELEKQNARVVQFVPETGLIVAGAEGTVFEAPNLERQSRVEPGLKISPNLVASGEERVAVLVEFYSDVLREDMMRIAVAEQVEVIANPDLIGWQLLLRVAAGKVWEVARWDEVAYVFPAAPELVNGYPTEGCKGPLTDSGMIGQLTQKVGDGWDGAGMNATTLGYFFSTYTGRLTPDAVRTEVLRAMAEWAKYVKISFAPASGGTAMRAIDVRFGARDHGDGYPFDGAGRTLAHTFFPSPPNAEPVAGDMHFDDDEGWSVGGNLDLYSVALHELGHALGLGHSDNPQAVMYPYYRKVTGLNAEDIGTIRQLYATGTGTMTNGPATPTAPGPPVITISQPAADPSSTGNATVAIGGTLSGGNGAVTLMWTNTRGGAGSVAGAATWTIAAVPLQTGENVITITAIDASRATISRQLRITRQAAAPVTITILSPVAAGSYTSGQPTVSLNGTAGPDGSVTRVFWTTSGGAGGSVNGSTAWQTGPVPLERGANRITVTAVGAQGQTASASLDVTSSGSTTNATGPDQLAPLLTITTPSASVSSTTAAAITISGTAADNVSIRDVEWVSGNTAGKAVGTTAWTIANYPLARGVNTVLIRVNDTGGNSSWRTLTITRN